MPMLAPPPSRPTQEPTEDPRSSAARERTLEQLLQHVRTLMDVDAAAFLVVDHERGSIEPFAGWFTSQDLRDAIYASAGRAYDRPLLLPRVEAWEAAPDLLGAMMNTLGETRAARVWAAYREAALICCPVKNAIGQVLGVLVVASLDPARPLRAEELRIVEVLADLSALALERSELLEGRAAPRP